MKFEIKNKFLKATFESVGAELISLQSKEREYIWEGNSKFWDKQSPVLFPTIGSLKNDTYFFEGNEYHLPRHGFAREKEFSVIEQTTDKIIFSLKNDVETLKLYPFRFELQIIYQLVDNRLEIRYSVENKSHGKMYFSIGGHPGFALTQRFTDYALLFESKKELKYSLLQHHLLSNEVVMLKTTSDKVLLDYNIFENDALVFKNHKIQSITIQEKGHDLIKVSFEQFPDLGIWTKVGAPFICIEPWFGHADEVSTNQDLEDKAGIQLLETGGLFTTLYRIEIF